MSDRENNHDANRAQHRQFYFLIYTQTDATVQGYACGSGLDIGLNDAGLDEARKSERRYKKNPLKFKAIVASPELRAVQMADILHDEVKAKMTIFRDFSDQFLGTLEGQKVGPGTDFTSPPRGESGKDFHARVQRAFQELLNLAGPIVLVTHDRVIKAGLLSLGLPPSELIGLVEPGELYAVDVPAGQGLPKVRKV